MSQTLTPDESSSLNGENFEENNAVSEVTPDGVSIFTDTSTQPAISPQISAAGLDRRRHILGLILILLVIVIWVSSMSIVYA
jgi:hypothetical protein